MNRSRALLFFSSTLLLTICFLVFHYQRSGAVQNGNCIDIPAAPDYLSSNNPRDAIAAINHARQLEHMPPLNLPANFYQLVPVQQQFLLLNLERTDRHLVPLVIDAQLSQMAQGYSQQLRDLNFFSHTSPIGGSFVDRINGNPALYNHYRLAAENLAGNPVGGIGPIYEYMYNDSIENCGHRKNILDPELQLVGIGLVKGSPYGTLSAQEFLTSAPWNPYIGGIAQQATPGLTLHVSNSQTNDKVLTVQQTGDDAFIRISWFIDTTKQPQHVGDTWTLYTKRLKKGKHTILVYGVDAMQNYVLVRYTIDT